MHSNEVLIDLAYSGSATATFDWSGQYNITGGQPWGGVTFSQGGAWPGEFTITAQAGRSGSGGPAQWFISNASGMVAADSWGASSPGSLNFAFTGTITVNCSANCGDAPTGTSTLPLVFGQGHTADADNWWIGGEGWSYFACPGGPWAMGNADGCMTNGTWTIAASATSANTFTLLPGS